jgi:XTP/dITP diphosphohydrolase
MPKLTLFLASTNPGKLREFQDAAAGMDVIVRPVPGISDLPPCVEDGCTFEANARKKALHYAAHRDGLIFADDSGLSVEALNGAPGVYSARFSGPGATDESNNRKLVLHLHREAAQIALAEGERILTIVEGGCDGVILDSPHGHGGFGYDPYFFYPPLGKTFAELTPEDKFRVSHRGIAFRKLLESLSEALPERRNLN